MPPRRLRTRTKRLNGATVRHHVGLAKNMRLDSCGACAARSVNRKEAQYVSCVVRKAERAVRLLQSASWSLSEISHVRCLALSRDDT
jgi:hypothetical protein